MTLLLDRSDQFEHLQSLLFEGHVKSARTLSVCLSRTRQAKKGFYTFCQKYTEFPFSLHSTVVRPQQLIRVQSARTVSCEIFTA